MRSSAGHRPGLAVAMAMAALLCLWHAALRGAPAELERVGCDTLCQARNMIVRAKQALDSKAQAELRILRSGQGSRASPTSSLVAKMPSHDRAREQELAMRPEHGVVVARSSALPHAIQTPRSDEAEPPRADTAQPEDASAETRSPTPHLAASTAVTKTDLKRFVDATLRKERAVIVGAPGVANSARGAGGRGPEGPADAHMAPTGLAHHAVPDAHPVGHSLGAGGRHWHQNDWCFDNPQWHGPFGDPCVAYATGGDRQFWCEWDGAGADNACPRSCGTCPWRSYAKADAVRERSEHLIQEHFDPQVPPPELGGQKRPIAPTAAASPNAAAHAPTTADRGRTLQDGPEEPKQVKRRRGMTRALFKDVEAMKSRLLEVAKATRAVAKEVSLVRPNNGHLSSEQAAADLAKFYSQWHAAGATPPHRRESDAHALADLLSFFDSEPGGGRGNASFSRQIVAGRTAEEKTKLARKAADARQAAIAHRLSSGAASSDMQAYWGALEAEVAQSSAAKSVATRHKGMTARAASRDLNSYLAKMVAKARVAHRAAVAAVDARRAMTHSDAEAVSSRKLTDAQARQALAGWWHKSMGARPAPAGSDGVKHARPEGIPSGGGHRGKDEGLAVFSADRAEKQLENMLDDVFPTPAAHLRGRGGAGPKRAHDGAARGHSSPREPDALSEDEARDDTARRLGLPEGGAQAVRVSHRNRHGSAASRADMVRFFDARMRRDNIAVARQRLQRRLRKSLHKGAPRRLPGRHLLPIPEGGSPAYVPSRYQPSSYAAEAVHQQAGAEVTPASRAESHQAFGHANLPMHTAFGAAYDG